MLLNEQPLSPPHPGRAAHYNFLPFSFFSSSSHIQCLLTEAPDEAPDSPLKKRITIFMKVEYFQPVVALK